MISKIKKIINKHKLRRLYRRLLGKHILRLRIFFRHYDSYRDYIDRQQSKTVDPKRRQKWLKKEWDTKKIGFREIFDSYPELVQKGMRALCLGARTGQEVAALQEMGVDAIGTDIVPHDPYVIEGDMHFVEFPANSFDFVFTNVYDHALYPDRLVAEMERVLKPGGVALLHLQVNMNSDEFTETVIRKSSEVKELLQSSDVIVDKEIAPRNFAGMNWEVAARKRSTAQLGGKVFGIGLPRSGTTSLTRALEKLGYRTLHNPKRLKQEQFSGRFRFSDDSWDAVANFGEHIYPQLDQAYPGSKFILTVRDKDAWLRSIRWKLSEKSDVEYGNRVRDEIFGSELFQYDRFAYLYDKHIVDVKTYFADRPDDILVLHLDKGEGWKELCTFLEKEVLSEPFPHVHTRMEMTTQRRNE